MKLNDIPKKYKVLKPWGYEYCIYRNSISSTKLLHLKHKKKTSLHCHPTKKTGFILLKGKAEVELGFYNKIKKKAISKLMIRPGLFHSTKNVGRNDSIILEIETPINKDDLVRFKDEYGRENKPYERKNKMIKLNSQDIIFKDPKLNSQNCYNVEGVPIKIIKTNKMDVIRKLKKNTIIAILSGGLQSIDKKYVLSPGDIVGSETVKKLSQVFKIKKNITFLKI